VRRQRTLGICACILGLLAVNGCSSSGNSVDTRPTVTQHDDAAISGVEAGPPAGPDASCGDDSAAGVSLCIINPPDNRGGGTIVTRQNPVPYQTCKAQ
jgi:hypothetical protein